MVEAARGLPVKAPGPSGLRVASMSLGLDCLVTQIREVDKLILGQDINAKMLYAIITRMNGQGHKWLTSSRMAHHQGLLCKNPRVRLEIV
jgi:hypothetical protein